MSAQFELAEESPGIWMSQCRGMFDQGFHPAEHCRVRRIYMAKPSQPVKGGYEPRRDTILQDGIPLFHETSGIE